MGRGEGSYRGGIQIHGGSAAHWDDSESLWKPEHPTPTTTLLSQVLYIVWCNVQMGCLPVALFCYSSSRFWCMKLWGLSPGFLSIKFQTELNQFTGKKKQDKLLNMKLRTINNGILECGLIVWLLNVFMYLPLCKLTLNWYIWICISYAPVSCRVPPQREETGPWFQEKYLSIAACCRLPLLQTHGSWTREHHSQLPGLILFYTPTYKT